MVDCHLTAWVSFRKGLRYFLHLYLLFATTFLIKSAILITFLCWFFKRKNLTLVNVHLHFCDLFCLQPFCLLFTFHQPACHTCFAFLVHPRWKVKWPNLNQNENYLCQHSPLPNRRIPNSIFSHSAPLHRSNSPLKSYKAWFMFAYLAIWKVSSTSQFGKPPALFIGLPHPSLGENRHLDQTG